MPGINIAIKYAVINLLCYSHTLTENATAKTAQKSEIGLQHITDIMSIMIDMVKCRSPGFRGMTGDAECLVYPGS